MTFNEDHPVDCFSCGKDVTPDECIEMKKCEACGHAHNHRGCTDCACPLCPHCRHVHGRHEKPAA